MQGSTCYGEQVQEEKKEFQILQKEQQRTECSNLKKIQKCVKNKKRRETEKELQYYQKIQISDKESKKSVSSLTESVESGVILSSSSG